MNETLSNIRKENLQTLSTTSSVVGRKEPIAVASRWAQNDQEGVILVQGLASDPDRATAVPRPLLQIEVAGNALESRRGNAIVSQALQVRGNHVEPIVMRKLQAITFPNLRLKNHLLAVAAIAKTKAAAMKICPSTISLTMTSTLKRWRKGNRINAASNLIDFLN